MFWTGFIVGIFVEANIGVVVAGLFAAKRRDAEDHSNETPMDHVVMDEVDDVRGKMPPFPKPVTYLDRYPHS